METSKPDWIAVSHALQNSMYSNIPSPQSLKNGFLETGLSSKFIVSMHGVIIATKAI
jgi:hypothetical protein